MGGDNDSVPNEACAVNCKNPSHKHQAAQGNDRKVPTSSPVEALSRAPGDEVSYLNMFQDNDPQVLDSGTIEASIDDGHTADLCTDLNVENDASKLTSDPTNQAMTDFRTKK